MATTAKQDAAGRRIKTKGEAPKAALVEKEITPTMERYVAWLKETTGYEADPMSVQLAGSLRGDFQKSEGNQAAIAAAKQAKLDLAEERAQKRADREQAKLDREAARAAKASEPKAEKAPVAKKPAVKTPAAKATPTRKAPAAKTGESKAPAAKPATTRRRAAKPVATEDDSAF